MPITRLPIIGKLPAAPKLRKIAIEETFVVSEAMELDDFSRRRPLSPDLGGAHGAQVPIYIHPRVW